MRKNSQSVHLETPRLILRRWHARDRPIFARINADPHTMRFYPAPLTEAESDSVIDRFETHIILHGYGFFAAEFKATGKCIGVIGMSNTSFDAHFTPCVEVGWRLSADYWNQGLATEGARAAIDYAFDALRLPEIVAITVPTNIPSRRVMEKLGMTHDPKENFLHPRVQAGHALQEHVLYRLSSSRWSSTGYPTAK